MITSVSVSFYPCICVAICFLRARRAHCAYRRVLSRINSAPAARNIAPVGASIPHRALTSVRVSDLRKSTPTECTALATHRCGRVWVGTHVRQSEVENATPIAKCRPADAATSPERRTFNQILVSLWLRFILRMVHGAPDGRLGADTLGDHTAPRAVPERPRPSQGAPERPGAPQSVQMFGLPEL